MHSKDTGIAVNWRLTEAVWRAAGRAFQQYLVRRRTHRDPGSRRILADVVIGAHALHHGFRLLTLDDRLYRATFPRLAILTV
jgi:predicted nucleic acid-binding protein